MTHLLIKECRNCHKIKEVDNFYRHSGMSSGYLNYCKDCVCARSRRWRDENLERIQEYDRQRSRPRPTTVKRWRQRYPDRYHAHTIIGNSIRAGRLKRQSCEICHSTPAHAHHDDYSKPLNVRWLCSYHHGEHHRKERAS